MLSRGAGFYPGLPKQVVKSPSVCDFLVLLINTWLALTASFKTLLFVHSDVHSNVRLGCIWSNNGLNIARVTQQSPLLNIILWSPLVLVPGGGRLVLASALHKRCTSLPGYHIANAAGTCSAPRPHIIPLIIQDSSLGYNGCAGKRLWEPSLVHPGRKKPNRTVCRSF